MTFAAVGLWLWTGQIRPNATREQTPWEPTHNLWREFRVNSDDVTVQSEFRFVNCNLMAHRCTLFIVVWRV